MTSDYLQIPFLVVPVVVQNHFYNLTKLFNPMSTSTKEQTKFNLIKQVTHPSWLNCSTKGNATTNKAWGIQIYISLKFPK